jgi:hypothetical protein
MKSISISPQTTRAAKRINKWFIMRLGGRKLSSSPRLLAVTKMIIVDFLIIEPCLLTLKDLKAHGVTTGPAEDGLCVAYFWEISNEFAMVWALRTWEVVASLMKICCAWLEFRVCARSFIFRGKKEEIREKLEWYFYNTQNRFSGLFFGWDL